MRLLCFACLSEVGRLQISGGRAKRGLAEENQSETHKIRK